MGALKKYLLYGFYYFYISFLLLTIIKQTTTNQQYTYLTPQNSKNKKISDTFIQEPFYFTKKGRQVDDTVNQKNNSSLTLTTFCNSNSIDLLHKIPTHFTNGPISISIYFSSKKQVISLLQLSQYFIHTNHSYDIHIGILYPNTITPTPSNQLDITNSLKNLSLFQVQTEYTLNIDINFYYLPPINISKISNIINDNKVLIIPSLYLKLQNELISENQNILIHNILKNTNNYLQLMQPKNDLLNFLKLSYICTNYSYFYITKTSNYYSMQSKLSNVQIIENMFAVTAVYPTQKLNQINICNHNITQGKIQTPQKKRKKGRPNKWEWIWDKVPIPLISVNNTINILIVMPIDYKFDIMKQINDLKYNSNQFNVYWLFNIYNFNECNDCKFIYDLNNSNIKITTYAFKNKIAFWINGINPNDKWISELSIDYIWLVDSDILFKYFNFNAFIELSYNLNASISQPIISPKCSNCRATDFDALEYNKNNIQRGLIGKTVHNIEMMAPLFAIETFEIIYGIIVEIFNMYKGLKGATWGYDRIWCGAAKLLIGNDCVIIHYTPIVHMNTQTINKSKEFVNAGKLMFRRLKYVFPNFWGYTYARKEFYIENDLIVS